MRNIRFLFSLIVLLMLCCVAEGWYCGSCSPGPCGVNYARITWSTTTPAYTASFSSGGVIDGSYYVICPGCTMSLTGIGAYYASCKCGGGTLRANLVAWTYNGSSMLTRTYNGASVPAGYTRTMIINSSQTCGVESSSAMSAASSFNVYTFSNPGRYKVYVDFIRIVCFTLDCYNYWWYIFSYPSGGWVPQNSYEIIVPRASIQFTSVPPSPQRSVSFTLSWTIKNNGVGKNSISITPTGCGDWSCSFVGYTSGTPVILDENSTYTVVMNVNPNGSSTTNRTLGISVSYDDGYGLTCISPSSISSLVTLNSDLNDADCTFINTPAFIPAGEKSSVELTFRNNGSTTWTAASNYRLGSADPQDNTIWGLSRVYLDGGDIITPNSTKTFSFNITAPNEPGTYNCSWRMLREGVEWFGEKCSNTIEVVTTTTTTTTTTLPKKKVSFAFRATDDKDIYMNCYLWTNESGTWSLYEEKANVRSGSIETFEIPAVSVGEYMWNVRCVDSANNEGWAPANWSFKVVP